MTTFTSTHPRPGPRRPAPCRNEDRSPSPPHAGQVDASHSRADPVEDGSPGQDHSLDPAHRKLCITVYPYSAVKNDELSFVEGEVIRVVRTVEGGWSEGQLHDRVGWFPANHVENHDIPPEEVDMQFVNTVAELDDLRLRTIMVNNEVRGDPLPSPTLSAKPDERLEGGARTMLLENLILSEKQYLETLQRFMDEFVYPLWAHSDWFPHCDHAAMFGNIEEVVDFEKEYLANLQDTLDGHQMIGKCFLDMVIPPAEIVFDIARTAVTVSTKYVQNAPMGRFLQTSGAVSTPPILHMVSNLHKPAQWKNRYQAAMHELLTATDASHPDRDTLTAACLRLDQIVEQIETTKRHNENKQLVQTLTSQLVGWEGPRLQLYGDLILEGNLKLLEGQVSNDADIKLNLLEKVPLNNRVIVTVADASEGDAMSLSFQLSYQTDDGKSKTLSISAFNAEQKCKWVESIDKRLEENVGAGPIIDDKDTSSCVSDTKLEKPGRSLKWFASWSGRIRRKRPSLPNLKDYADSSASVDSTRPPLIRGSSAADLSTASGLLDDYQRFPQRGPKQTLLASRAAERRAGLSAPLNAGLPPVMPLNATPSLVNPAIAPAAEQVIAKASNTATFENGSKNTATSSPIQVPMSQGDFVSKLSQSADTTTPTSSSPASFLWMQSQNHTPGSLPTGPVNLATSGPRVWKDNVSLSVSNSSPRRKSTASNVTELSILSPIAKADTRVPVEALEVQAAQALLEPLPSRENMATDGSPRAPGQLTGRRPGMHSSPIELTPADARQSSALAANTSPLRPYSIAVAHLPPQRPAPSPPVTGIRSFAAGALDRCTGDGTTGSAQDTVQAADSTKPRRFSYVPKAQLPTSKRDNAANTSSPPIRTSVLSIYPSANPTHVNPSTPVLSVRPPYEFPARAGHPNLTTSMSMANLNSPTAASSNKPSRKASAANLLLSLKGSMRSMFKRSQSTDALTAGKMSPEQQELPPQQREPPGGSNQQHRKSSIIDIKDFFFKGKRKPETVSGGTGTRLGAGLRPARQALTDRTFQPAIAATNPVKPVTRLQHVLSPPQSARTSDEKTDPTPFALDDVPMPSPLPVAPASQGYTPPETPVPGQESSRVMDTREASDSGVYGLRADHAPEALPTPLETEREKETYTRLSESTMPSRAVTPGTCLALPGQSETSTRAESPIPASPMPEATTANRPTTPRLRSQSLVVDSSRPSWNRNGSSTNVNAMARLHDDDDDDNDNDETKREPRRVLRRARSNIGRRKEGTISCPNPPQARVVVVSRSDDSLVTTSSAGDLHSKDDPSGKPVQLYGPVLGQLERTWYVDLAQKCEAMSCEIKELREELGKVGAGGQK
ncbi:hypothetical protein HKX48_000476 [Thoreauomyces humboldtii]|nr:hypothetical protein HKX48_000476 [Thoreauomyces humboldtii]